MPALTAAEREFLKEEWRWAEAKSDTILARHSGAREAELPSLFITLAGAAIALNIIHLATSGTRKLIIATVEGVVNASFKSRPRTVRVFHARFGGDAVAGADFVCERADRDHGARRTTLYLIG